jgi:hypothetical protein
MLVWDRYEFDKKRVRTSYAEPVFLHSLGFVCHLVHYGASGVRNVDSLFFMLGLDWYGFNRSRGGIHYAKLVFLHSVGSAGHVVHSGVSGV